MATVKLQNLVAAVVLIAGIAVLVAPSPALAQALDVRVEHGWARPAIAGGNGAAYLVITNAGDQPVTLIGASSDVARFVEIHETYVIEPAHAHEGDEHAHHHDDHEAGHHDDHAHDHGTTGALTAVGMRKVDGIRIEAGASVSFAPGGYHVMLIDLVEGLAWGREFEVVLHFEGGHSVSTIIEVGSEPAH